MLRARGSRASPDGVKRRAPGRLAKQRRAQGALQRAQRLGDRGLRDAQRPGGAGVTPGSTTATKTRRCRSSSSVFTATSYHRRGRCGPSAFWSAGPAGARGSHARDAKACANPEALLRRRRPAGLRRADAGAGATTRRWRQRVAELLGAWRSSNRPVIHVQHMSTDPDLAAAARPARQRVQGRGGSQAGRAGDREARQQLLHRDVARVRPAARRPRHAGDRRTRPPITASRRRRAWRQPRVRHLGRLRCHRHVRPRRTGRTPVSRGADPRDRALRPPRRIRHRGRHGERALGRRCRAGALGLPR